MNKFNVMTLCDFYKISHRCMYPQGTEIVYSTWTPRTSRLPGVNEVVCFGLQAFIKDKLLNMFQEEFFERDKQAVVSDYKRLIRNTLGDEEPGTRHIEELHDLGFLPLSICALPEGTLVPVRVPMFSIHNTDPRFYWLTNYIETLASCELWQPSTSATIAHQYRLLFDSAAGRTGTPKEFVPFQGHDFSMRGLSSLGTAISSGMGHLLSFVGTDTIPAIQGAEIYYNANIENELIGTSIPASEHSIQCAYEDDMKYFAKLMKEVHPTGMVSIVSDGYDFWDVMGRVLPALKQTILERDGKVVIRPDSGDPVDILCGDFEGETELQRKGAVEVLWDIFGGSINEKGFKVLHPTIGLIYGDAITLDRAQEILGRLEVKGFASSNVVFGIGSFSYQYNTRDTFGFALKSTLCQIQGKEKHIFKDPKTGDGVKKSQKGRVAVRNIDGILTVTDGHSLNEEIAGDLMVEVFRNGQLLVDQTFQDIKMRLASA